MAFSRTHITNCVKQPRFIKDPILKEGLLIEKMGGGGPLFWNGGFSIVFKILKMGKYWAFKIWHTPLTNMEIRYGLIRDFLNGAKLSYFVDFEYEPQGLFDGTIYIATHRMKWVEGELLHEYIENYISQPNKLLAIASKFKKMTMIFHENGISHGDLQHGNIVVRPDGKLAVIDYDSMFVNSMVNMPDIIQGQAGYQHPQRMNNEYSNNYLDNFSEILIYLSLIVYAEKPELWDKGTDWLLFSKEDLANPENCDLMKELSISQNLLIAYLTKILLETLSYENISDIPSLGEILSSSTKKVNLSSIEITDKF